MGAITGREPVLAVRTADGPVVVLAGTVDARDEHRLGRQVAVEVLRETPHARQQHGEGCGGPGSSGSHAAMCHLHASLVPARPIIGTTGTRRQRVIASARSGQRREEGYQPMLSEGRFFFLRGGRGFFLGLHMTANENCRRQQNHGQQADSIDRAVGGALHHGRISASILPSRQSPMERG